MKKAIISLHQALFLGVLIYEGLYLYGCLPLQFKSGDDITPVVYCLVLGVPAIMSLSASVFQSSQSSKILFFVDIALPFVFFSPLLIYFATGGTVYGVRTALLVFVVSLFVASIFAWTILAYPENFPKSPQTGAAVNDHSPRGKRS